MSSARRPAWGSVEEDDAVARRWGWAAGCIVALSILACLVGGCVAFWRIL